MAEIREDNTDKFNDTHEFTDTMVQVCEDFNNTLDVLTCCLEVKHHAIIFELRRNFLRITALKQHG